MIKLITLCCLIAPMLAAVANAQVSPNGIMTNGPCFDMNSKCRMWAFRGECYKNKGFMDLFCADTCGYCKVRDHRCVDKNLQCPGWASRGHCQSNRKYMKQTCSKSCAFCMAAKYHEVPHVHHDVVTKKWKEWEERFSRVSNRV